MSRKELKQRIKKRASGLAPFRPASKTEDDSSSDQEAVQQRLELQKQEIMNNRFKMTVPRKTSVTKPSTATNLENIDQQSTTTTSSTIVPKLKRLYAASSERDSI